MANSSAPRKRATPDWQAPRFEPCVQCSNGWLDYGGHVRRCYCWLDHQARVAQYRQERERKHVRGTAPHIMENT
jgi:hypothetical protein